MVEAQVAAASACQRQTEAMLEMAGAHREMASTHSDPKRGMDKPTLLARDAVGLQEELKKFRRYMHEFRLSHPCDWVTLLRILSKEIASRADLKPIR